MKSNLFEAYDSHCNHGNVDMPGARCTICQEDERMLATAPPFEVICVDADKCVLKSGETYTALAVVSSGSITGEALPVLFISSESNPKTAHPFGYSLRRFIRKT